MDAETRQSFGKLAATIQPSSSWRCFAEIADPAVWIFLAPHHQEWKCCPIWVCKATMKTVAAMIGLAAMALASNSVSDPLGPYSVDKTSMTSEKRCVLQLTLPAFHFQGSAKRIQFRRFALHLFLPPCIAAGGLSAGAFMAVQVSMLSILLAKALQFQRPSKDGTRCMRQEQF